MAVKHPDIKEYIKSFPLEVQEILEQIRKTIKESSPETEETINYGIPTFKLKGANLVNFAGYKNHIGFYATPTGHEKFKEELSEYVQGKGSVQFPLDKPMPFKLITKIVEFRTQETLEKLNTTKSGKSKKKLPEIDSVDDFVKSLNHPLEKEINQLRKIIIEANKDLSEIIKWNAPSYCFKNEDRITLRIHPPKNIQIIFHCGAKVRVASDSKIIQDKKGMLKWATNNRAIATFSGMEEINKNAKELKLIINDWIEASNNLVH